jgi:tetratricopeptide (TPR) repeat protein
MESALNGLAMVCKYTARYAEAGRLYRRALPLARASRDTALVASIYHNLGGLEHALGRFALAEPFARRSVRLRVRALGQAHPDVAADKAALAAILDGRGKDAEAEALYREAIGCFARHLGARHFEVGFNWANLAALYHKMGRRAKAERAYARALRILEGTVGRNHPVVAGTLRNFGMLREEQGRWAEATRIGRRVLMIQKAVLGGSHPHALEAQERLKGLLRRGANGRRPRS